VAQETTEKNAIYIIFILLSTGTNIRLSSEPREPINHFHFHLSV
jgi:hypothetical protein